MLSFFHRLFLPSARNAYRPLLLGDTAFVVYAVILVVLKLNASFAGLALSQSNLFAQISYTTLYQLTDQDRQAYHLQSLAISPLLVEAAQLKANDMLVHNYFGHYSPTGVSPWYWFGKAGYAYTYAGENLAANFNSTSQLEHAWMASPEHRANILDPHYADIGIAIRTGYIGNDLTTVVVELFGAPANGQGTVVSLQKPQNPPPALATTAPTVAAASSAATLPVAVPSVIAPPAAHGIAWLAQNIVRWWSMYAQSIITISYELFLAFIIILAVLNIFVEYSVQHSSVIVKSIFLITMIVVLMNVNVNNILGFAFHLQ